MATGQQSSGSNKSKPKNMHVVVEMLRFTSHNCTDSTHLWQQHSGDAYVHVEANIIHMNACGKVAALVSYVVLAER